MDDALRAPVQPVDNAHALPTARTFAHMPTASYYDELKKAGAPYRPCFELRHRIVDLAGHRMRHKQAGEM